MIKVYIVDDHLVVIEGIYSLLQNETGIAITGFAINGHDCLAYFTNHTADVILMDISLPDINGIDLCSRIKKDYPGIMVLALSTFNQGSYIKKMMDAGASGYLLKNTGKDEIIEAIQSVAGGNLYLSFETGKELKASMEEKQTTPLLTKREIEILSHIANGLTNVQIAEMLFLSIDTINSHRKSLHHKLGVKNTALLIRYAVENKLV